MRRGAAVGGGVDSAATWTIEVNWNCVDKTLELTERRDPCHLDEGRLSFQPRLKVTGKNVPSASLFHTVDHMEA